MNDVSEKLKWSQASIPAGAEEVHWDKDAPQGPPTPLVRQVPEWFADVYRFLQTVAADEGLVLDICLERAIEIVRFNHDRGLVGIDLMPDLVGQQSLNRTGLVAMSIPLAVELYKQVLASLNGPQKAAFEAVVKRALEKRDAKAGVIQAA